MDGHASGEENIDWDTEDELEIQNIAPSSCASIVTRDTEAVISNGEASSSAGSSNSKVVQQFLGMGFSEKLVAKAIKDNGEGNPESILETLLTYSALEDSPEEHNPCYLNSPQPVPCVDDNDLSSDYDENLLEDFSESDSWSDHEITENCASLPEHDKKISSLAAMGYTVEEASAAMDRCGPDASIAELTDFICAAQMAKTEPVFFEDEKPKKLFGENGKLKKRKTYELERWKRKKQKGVLTEEDEVIRLPNPMIGFGVPSQSSVATRKTLPEAAMGPPFFYYENVALAPKGVWDTISRFLYDVEPEFVDSRYFCAAARKRGYVHNLPIDNRFPLLPLPPRTISDALPLTKRWWPEWDKRTKLNCLQTVIGSARLTERIRKALEKWGDNPPPHVQKYVIEECRKWNLVWVGKNKVAPLEPDEVEMLLGFPRNHTRGGGISRTDRYKSLGNSFQVDTVAYHLSVLKDKFPNGINMLSLFSGIGGAEVALHRLGIPLNNVVSVEISEPNRDIVRSWWEQTNQKGNLIHLVDVQELHGDKLEQLIGSFGGFDLVIGGSPCNNLAGSNRVSRDGLEDQIPYIDSDTYVAYNNEKGGVIESLKEDNIANLDSGVQSLPEWVSTMAMINSWLSDAILYELWVGSDGSSAHKIYYSDLPWPIGKLLYLKQVRNVKQLLGISKETAERREEEIYRRATIAYQALSTKLGEESFFSDNRPTSLDATFLGHALITLYALPETSVLRGKLLEQANLVKYADKHKAELLDVGSSSSDPSSSSAPRRGPSNWSSKPKSQPKRERTQEEKSFRRKAKYFLVTQLVAVLVFLSLLGGADDDEVVGDGDGDSGFDYDD